MCENVVKPMVFEGFWKELIFRLLYVFQNRFGAFALIIRVPNEFRYFVCNFALLLLVFLVLGDI